MEEAEKTEGGTLICTDLRQSGEANGNRMGSGFVSEMTPKCAVKTPNPCSQDARECTNRVGKGSLLRGKVRGPGGRSSVTVHIPLA